MTDLNISTPPYLDDYNKAKQFYKVLFQSGQVPQVREFNQLQTILQSQFQRFSSHFFQNGSLVIPGNTHIDKDLYYVKVENISGGTINDLVGSVIQGMYGVTATVEKVIEATGSDPDTLYVRYQSSGTPTGVATGITTAQTFIATESITDGTVSCNVISTPVSGPTDVTGQSFWISIDQGIYYVNQEFVQVYAQSIVVGKYTTDVTTRVGLDISYDIVKYISDSSLLDNANTSNNSAPGADRLKISLTLVEKDFSDRSDDANFIFLMQFRNGNIEQKVQNVSYNIFGDELARRTFEESGNYRPAGLQVKIENDLNDNTKLQARVSAGTAFIGGYEGRLDSDQILSIDKETSTSKTENNLGFQLSVYCQTSDLVAFPDITSFESVDIVDRSTPSTIYATARVRNIENIGSGVYKIYLFDIVFDTTYDEVSAPSISMLFDGNAVDLDVVSDASYSNVEKTKTIFGGAISMGTKTPSIVQTTDQVSAITLASSTYSRWASYTATSGSNEVVINASGSETFSADVSAYVITDDTTSYEATGVVLSNSDQTATITTTIASSTSVDVLAQAIYTGLTKKSKTLTNSGTVSLTYSSGKIELTDYDIYDIVSITDSNGVDLTSKFSLDNGQRDNYYYPGTLTYNGSSYPYSTSVDVVYRYWAHGTGDCFLANSYASSGIDHYELPVYTATNGAIYQLVNCLDFRIKKTRGGSITAGNKQPSVNTFCDVVYDAYNGRVDTLYAQRIAKTDFISVGLLKGLPSLTPYRTRISRSDTNRIPLYEIRLLPNTGDRITATLNALPSKGYTMSDIGDLETRIENLEEIESLDLLEKATSDLKIYDADGNERFKSGFFVDNFSSLLTQDLSSLLNNNSVDVVNKTLRPKAAFYALNLVDEDGKNDDIILPYTEVPVVSQPLSNNYISINPYDIRINTGKLTLDPPNDNFSERIGGYDGGDLVIRVQDLRALYDSGIDLSKYFNQWGLFISAISTTVSRGTTTVLSSDQQAALSSNQNKGLLSTITGHHATSNAKHLAKLFSVEDVNSYFHGDAARVARQKGLLEGFTDVKALQDAGLTTKNLAVHGRTGVLISKGTYKQSTFQTDQVPWFRHKIINFQLENCTPNTRYYAFFDGIDVNNYVGTTVIDIDQTDYLENYQKMFESGVFQPEGIGSAITDELIGLVQTSEIITDENGKAQGYFSIPQNTFRADKGPVKFRMTSDPLNSVETPSGSVDICEADYSAIGSIKATKGGNVWLYITRPDPVAQSFSVSSLEGGYFVTSIDLYFKAKPTNLDPVQVGIYPMVNGLPMTSGYYTIKELPQEDVFVSDDASVPTRFTFDTPLYLEQGTEYSIIVSSNNREYQVFYTNLNSGFEVASPNTNQTATRAATTSGPTRSLVKDLTTGQYITKQANSGVFFKSFNNTTWTADQLSDLKFVLNRASFQADSKSFIRREALSDGQMFTSTIPVGNLKFLGGSKIVELTVKNHSLENRNIVLVNGFRNSHSGYSADDLNNSIFLVLEDETHPITDDKVYLTFQDLTKDDFVGDSVVDEENIVYTRNIKIDGEYVNCDIFEPEGTKVNLSIRNTFDTLYQPIEQNTNLYRKTPSVVYNSYNSVAPSVQLEIQLITNSDHLSPLVGGSSLAVYPWSNEVNFVDSEELDSELSHNSEYDGVTNRIMYRYISQPINLIAAASSLRVYISLNLNEGNSVKFYMRTKYSEQVSDSIDNTSWTEISPIEPLQYSGRAIDDNYVDYSFESDDVDIFNIVQLKVVFLSNNSSLPPTAKDLRVIALA